MIESPIESLGWLFIVLEHGGTLSSMDCALVREAAHSSNGGVGSREEAKPNTYGKFSKKE